MKDLIKIAVLCVPLMLAGCGGGGDDDQVEPSARSTNYWTMDAHRYQRAQSTQEQSLLGSGNTLTIALATTESVQGGDTSNGAYSGSALSFSMLNKSPGTYTVVPSLQALLQPVLAKQGIVVEVTVGASVTTGASHYGADSGTVVVTQDGTGRLHFSTPAALRMSKRLDALGGVRGAPASMGLTVQDVH